MCFCVTLCADLRKKVDPSTGIYIVKSSRAIHLTCRRDTTLNLFES